MALNLQAQTLADAAKVIPQHRSTPHSCHVLAMYCHCLSADVVAVCLPYTPKCVVKWILHSFRLILPCLDAPLFVTAG